MDDLELDSFLATRIMGWKRIDKPLADHGYVFRVPGGPYVFPAQFQPTRSLDDCGLVLCRAMQLASAHGGSCRLEIIGVSSEIYGALLTVEFSLSKYCFSSQGPKISRAISGAWWGFGNSQTATSSIGLTASEPGSGSTI